MAAESQEESLFDLLPQAVLRHTLSHCKSPLRGVRHKESRGTPPAEHSLRRWQDSPQLTVCFKGISVNTFEEHM